jgi:hypothetical protein
MQLQSNNFDLQGLADVANATRVTYNHGRGATGASAANIPSGNTVMTDTARYPPEDDMVSSPIPNKGGGQCAECHLAVRIKAYADAGGTLPNTIVIVESQVNGKDPCPACQVNLPKILGGLGRRIEIYNANDLSKPAMVINP